MVIEPSRAAVRALSTRADALRAAIRPRRARACRCALAACAALLLGCGDDSGASDSGEPPDVPVAGGDGAVEAGRSGSRGAAGGEQAPVPTTSPTGAADFGPRDHVSGERYSGILLEIDYVRGKEPDSAALGLLEDRIRALAAGGYLGKPDGLRVVIDEPIEPFGSDTVHTFADLRALEPGLRSVAPMPGESAIHMLYVDGSYEQDGDTFVLGFASQPSWIVMFRDNLDRACASSSLLDDVALLGLTEEVCTVSEASTLVHELGHLFGLVDNGTPMVNDHRDPEHGAHDRDPECLMYWLVETDGVVDQIAQRFLAGQQAVPELDAECLRDLRAVADAP